MGYYRVDGPPHDSHCGADDANGGLKPERGGMDDIAELERRITSALVRIGQGLEGLARSEGDARGAPVATLADGAAEAEIARLNEALDEEKMVTAQLQERIRALRDRDAADRRPLQTEVERLTRLLDSQGLEMQRLKKTVSSLREQLRLLTEAQAEGRIEPHLINKAMLTELEALRALRGAEAAELDEIIAALDPLAASAQQDGATDHA